MINEPKIATIDPIGTIEKERVWQKLHDEGHDMAWVKEGKVRQRLKEGWEPVAERNKLGRRTIFMDRKRELLLIHRKPSNEEAAS